MTLTFSLGMNQNLGVLSTVQAPGLYWVNIDRKLDADRFCRQVIIGLPAQARAALICQGEDPAGLLVTIKDVTVSKLPLFILPLEKEALIHLSTDLERSLKPDKHLFIIMTNANEWYQFNEQEIQQWVQKTHQWLNQHQCCALILSHGPGASQIKNQLYSQHRCLDGLSGMQWQQERGQYVVSWWGTANGLTTDQVLNIKEVNHSLHFEPETNQKTALTLNDEQLYFADKEILEESLPPSEYWHLLDGNQFVFAQGEKAQAATLIFSLYNSSEIDKLARQIHHLRTHCGDALKIVVREMSNDIRYSDEQLLLACGASLYVPFGVSLPKLQTMIEHIQGQRFTRPVAEDIEAILKAIIPISLKGYVPLKEFLQTVLNRVSNTLLAEHSKGILVALLPERDVDLKEALTLCELKRPGDIVTIADHNLFLFLATCSLSDLDMTLSFIFKQPINVLFSSHVVWSQDPQILTKIRQLMIYQNELGHEESIQVTQSEPQKPIEIIRRVPVDITLLTSKQKETPYGAE